MGKQINIIQDQSRRKLFHNLIKFFNNYEHISIMIKIIRAIIQKIFHIKIILSYFQRYLSQYNLIKPGKLALQGSSNRAKVMTASQIHFKRGYRADTLLKYEFFLLQSFYKYLKGSHTCRKTASLQLIFQVLYKDIRQMFNRTVFAVKKEL